MNKFGLVLSTVLLSFSLVACSTDDKASAAAEGAKAVASTAAAVATQETIRIGVEGAYPPFSKVDADGKLSGFDIDIANALCADMKAKCELIKQDWDGIIPALLAKKYDAIIASMSITEERKQKVNFTKRYYQSPARFIHKTGSGATISKEGLNGKSVGVQRGTVSDKFITGVFGEGVDIKRYGTQEEAYLDLNAGRIEMIFADAFVLMEFLAKDEGKAYEFIGDSYTDAKYFGEGIGIAIRKDDSALEAKLNASIDSIRSNGTYDKVSKKYFAFDVYGE